MTNNISIANTGDKASRYLDIEITITNRGPRSISWEYTSGPLAGMTGTSPIEEFQWEDGLGYGIKAGIHYWRLSDFKEVKNAE